MVKQNLPDEPMITQAESLDAENKLAEKLAHDLQVAGFKLETNPDKADINIQIEEGKRLIITTADGKRHVHDFSCNSYYAEMFRVLRELIGIDSRVKWFNNIKDKFFGTVCFGGGTDSKWPKF